MKTSRASSVTLNVVAYLSTVLFLIPVYILINLAFRPVGDTTSPLLPSLNATLDNFVGAWTQSELPKSIITSALVTTISCLVVVTLATMAAYPLARSTARWSNMTFYLFLVGLLLPFQVAILPVYVQMRDIGLLGSIWSLVIFSAGLQMPFSIFIITTFLRTAVSPEYEEAARIDGCSDTKAFFFIVVPLLRPVLGTVIVLNAVGIWNDFFTPLLFLAGSGQSTIPVAIYSFVGAFSTNWSFIFAALIISMIPILVLYLIFQRFVIQGFAGGLKG